VRSRPAAIDLDPHPARAELLSRQHDAPSPDPRS
jgi:hypothetical protein